MDALYHQTNLLLQQVAGEELGRLESTINAPDRKALYEDIQQKLRTVDSNCSRLDILVNKEPASRRSNAKYKVDQLKYDYRHILSSVDTIEHRRAVRERQQQEREALFTTTFERPDTAVTLDGAELSLAHQGRLRGADRGVEDMLASGEAVLAALRGQGAGLRAARRKVLDLANTLGMSNTVMRLVERRANQDWYVLVGGCVLVLVVLYLLLRYL